MIFLLKLKAISIVSISWDDERLKLGSTLWLGKPQQEIIECLYAL